MIINTRISLQEIPDKLKNIYRPNSLIEGYEDTSSASRLNSGDGRSSIDYDINGLLRAGGKDYYKLSGLFQKIAMNATNKYWWEIPYNVHH